MDLNTYQIGAVNTAIYPGDVALPYLALGLGNEAGEVQGKIKKYLRGDYDDIDLRVKLIGELGDVLWYLSVLAYQLDISLGAIALANLDKLADRKARGKLKGDGDTR